MTIDIGKTPQLFVDDLIVDEIHGVTSTLHQPAKYAGNPIMTPLYPWEGRLTLYGTVWRNEETGRFRMWYQGYGGMGIPRMGDETSDSPWKGFDGRNLLYTIGYATSDDGVFWERPNLGLIEYEGSRDNNLVMLDAAYANIIKDPRDPDPDRLYKSLFFEARDPAGTPNMGDGVSVAFSPDGIRWTKYHGNPVITRSSDSHTLLGWDDLHGKYVSFARPSVHEGNMTRRIGRSTSDDFISWTVPEDVLVPDDDPPGLEFYGMPAFKYHDLYIGQLLAYHTPPEEPQIRFMEPSTCNSPSAATVSTGNERETEYPSSRTARREASTPVRFTWRVAPSSLTTSFGSTTRPAPSSMASPDEAAPSASPSSGSTASSPWTPATRRAP